nr:hypothetical protein [Streptomyces sp. CB02959]
MDGASEAAHERRHLSADGEFTARASFYQADALDTADLGGLGPFAPEHVQLGVVEAESLDFDHDVTGLGFGFR